MLRVTITGALALWGLTGIAVPATASEVELHELYYCVLSDLTGVGGRPTKQVDMEYYTPFGFSRMSRPGEPNRFGFDSSTTNSIGIGQLQEDGRWIIRDWSEQSQTEPKITLVTFLPNNNILVSIYAGSASHVTFRGECEPRDLPEQ
ncbi:hypothetical protein [Ruegeria sp.]|uniref:hypothetical protein n=1 Tax=Ruegeria sp. TaxID=1879320 RepID=UPI003C7AD8B6